MTVLRTTSFFVAGWSLLLMGCSQGADLSWPERSCIDKYRTLVVSNLESPELVQLVAPQERQQFREVVEEYGRYRQAKRVAVALVKARFGRGQAQTLEKALRIMVEDQLPPVFLGPLDTSWPPYQVSRIDGTALIYRQNESNGMAVVNIGGQYCVSKRSWSNGELSMTKSHLRAVAGYLEDVQAGIQSEKIDQANIGKVVVLEWKGGRPPDRKPVQMFEPPPLETSEPSE